ncbi:MAG: D-cysteine desulfhydrase family protein [Pseudomonadota bacterium]
MTELTDVHDALARYPRVELAEPVTPLAPTPNLSAHLGIELLVKRDDCQSLALGGNKVRQLEFYMGEAVESGADTVLITGAVQSNFVRLTAAAARRLGLDVHVQLENRVDTNDPLYQRSGNVLLDRLLGATIHRFPIGEDEAAADANLEHIAGELSRNGARPYVIHLGMDHRPIGALGYVRAALEIVEQLASLDTHADHLVVASGSGLTHAGLLAGIEALNYQATVHGICVRRDAERQRARIKRRVGEVSALLECNPPPDDRIRITDDTLSPGYGKMNDAVAHAMQLTAESEGILLDPVYTGKTMAGLIKLIASDEITPGARVVFIHTGGTPALFGYQQMLEEYF